ncbi:hypothetical protein FZI85_19745 [Mycobacterium sp. CBMA293]|nr:hypothetical protein [Mycolicibacterium sp. CBMA 360]MUL60917.1 hypothetical protein [Mycolicibacterium sp. CBMA 335]MUL71930.1 hypothetical protein [Mycolicibacterium sp. CBMA 311]MUL95858.1 hypothetical protein [Mycolicibacterium sp. CBMA 230]MUM13245.1 hypothetical protein [Mycolicibacterium sp. CBMA 293]MUM31881.1 hypothetical protein [Mycolicibacterium sp. CBMA 361]
MFFSEVDRYSIGIELSSGTHYVSIAVSNGSVDYEEYYAISQQQLEVWLSDKSAAVAFVEACRRHQHDDLMILKPGSNRGTPV